MTFYVYFKAHEVETCGGVVGYNELTVDLLKKIAKGLPIFLEIDVTYDDPGFGFWIGIFEAGGCSWSIYKKDNDVSNSEKEFCELMKAAGSERKNEEECYDPWLDQ